MTSLASTLNNCSKVLDANLDILQEYRSLDPRIDLYARCLGMLSSMGTELEHSSTDMLNELSGIPSNFVDALNNVNLYISAEDQVVSISVMERETYPPNELVSVHDTNLVSALLKVYNFVFSDTPFSVTHFSTRLNSSVSSKGKVTCVPYVATGSIVFEDLGQTPQEFDIEELVVGHACSTFAKVVSINDNYIELEWLSSFQGTLSVTEQGV